MSNAEIEELQIKMAYLESHLEAMSEEMAQQQATQSKLEKQIKYLYERFKTLQSLESDINTGPETPPHY